MKQLTLTAIIASLAGTGCATMRGAEYVEESDRGGGDGATNLIGRKIQGSLPTLGSYELVDLGKYYGGVTAVVVWSARSPECRDSLSFFANVHDRFRKRGATVVSINVDEDYRLAEEVKAQQDLPFSVFRDPGGDLTRKLGLTQLPATLVLNTESRVVAAFTGYEERTGAAIVSAMDDEVRSQPVKVAEVPASRGPSVAALDMPDRAFEEEDEVRPVKRVIKKKKVKGRIHRAKRRWQRW